MDIATQIRQELQKLDFQLAAEDLYVKQIGSPELQFQLSFRLNEITQFMVIRCTCNKADMPFNFPVPFSDIMQHGVGKLKRHVEDITQMIQASIDDPESLQFYEG